LHFPATTTKEEINDLRFLTGQQNLLLLGSTGTGNTHFATTLGVKACEKGYEVRFFRVSESKLKRQIEKCDLLILDEFGYVPFQKQGSELLFHIIVDCYEHKSVIVTSNLEFGQWNRVFGDNRLTSALVDRLVHPAHIITMTSADFS
jgi:DNA replication protein DnaC